MNNVILVKLGGKILENEQNLNNTISQLYQLIEITQNINKIIIIPGGGTIANFVRTLDQNIKLGDDLAHWEAIYAMNWNGQQINKNYPNIPCFSQISELKKNISKKDNKSLLIFLPFHYLFENDLLPHRWDITSDSISIFIAKSLELDQCFLIKDIDGIYNIHNKTIKRISTKDYLEYKKSNKIAEINNISNNIKNSKPIDLYALKLIDENRIKCYILNGIYSKSRILEYFSQLSENLKIYTEIYY